MSYFGISVGALLSFIDTRPFFRDAVKGRNGAQERRVAYLGFWIRALSMTLGSALRGHHFRSSRLLPTLSTTLVVTAATLFRFFISLARDQAGKSVHPALPACRLISKFQTSQEVWVRLRALNHRFGYDHSRHDHALRTIEGGEAVPVYRFYVRNKRKTECAPEQRFDQMGSTSGKP